MLEYIRYEDIKDEKNVVYIDVRSLKEYEEDHIYNAINIPVLNDKERHEVGCVYKNESKEDAIRLGIKYTSNKILDFYDVVSRFLKENKKVVFYCFRGGMRSNSIANTISAFNKKVYLLEGGYKQYRKYILNYINNIEGKFEFKVLSGFTGVGKTEILKKLKQNGKDILDLEYLARNKGSVFGEIGYDVKTTQRLFETELVYELEHANSNEIYLESESKRIGNIVLPNTLHNEMVKGIHYLIKTNINNRVDFIVKDYFYQDKDFNIRIKNILEKFRKGLSNEIVDNLIGKLDNKEYDSIVRELCVLYYDPLYQKSIDKYEYQKIIEYNFIDEAVDILIKE